MPLLFNFAVEYAIRRVQVSQDSFKLNGTHRLLVYTDNVNIMGGNVHTIKENAEALVVAGKESGLDARIVDRMYGEWTGCKESGLDVRGLDWM